jgi:hypothetical protein
MKKEKAETSEQLVSRLYTATIQNRRCLALLNHIVRDNILVSAPLKIARGPSAAAPFNLDGRPRLDQ